MIAPQVDAPCIVIAEEQEEYKPVSAALVLHPLYGVAPGREHNSVLLAFRPSNEERARLVSGADVYISLLTFGGPMQPILVMCGKEEAAQNFGIEVSP
jgi:hypothetical protein